MSEKKTVTMKVLLVLMGLIGAGVPLMVQAEQSVYEKTKASGNDTKRSVKKSAHRIEEAVCAKDDAKCLAEKVENRVEEGVDYVQDKAAAAVDAVDGDRK